MPVGHRYRSVVISSLNKSGGVSRQTTERIASDTSDQRLYAALGYAFEEIVAMEQCRGTIDTGGVSRDGAC